MLFLARSSLLTEYIKVGECKTPVGTKFKGVVITMPWGVGNKAPSRLSKAEIDKEINDLFYRMRRRAGIMD